MDEHHPVPSRRARELVAGAFDTHVHVAPDVLERRVDDVTLARRFAEVGLAGFVLKSHYVPTAERAAVVRGVVPGVAVLGSITLNAAVGGINPVAVEIAAREGARMVWLPTVDSRNQRRARPGTGTAPMWAALQDQLATPPVEIMDGDGGLREEVVGVLRLLASHDLVLATGHLSGEEISAVVTAATGLGVRRIVVTHPEFTSQRLPVARQRELAEAGALLERCFTTPYTGKVSWQTMLDNIRAVGPAHSLLSSDLGQPFNPPVEDGLALFADRLLAEGFTEDDIHTMAVVNSRRIGEAR